LLEFNAGGVGGRDQVASEEEGKRAITRAAVMYGFINRLKLIPLDKIAVISELFAIFEVKK